MLISVHFNLGPDRVYSAIRILSCEERAISSGTKPFPKVSICRRVRRMWVVLESINFLFWGGGAAVSK